jgi:hypothetical protein
MIIKDDRTLEQLLTHTWAVVGRDKFLSGWGGATGGYSRCGWACKPEDIDAVEAMVRSRSEMQYVNVVQANTYRPPKGTAHYHLYVWKGDN